jgi:hypothetical protein
MFVGAAVLLGLSFADSWLYLLVSPKKNLANNDRPSCGGTSFTCRLGPSALLIFPWVKAENPSLNFRFAQLATWNGTEVSALASSALVIVPPTLIGSQFVGLNVKPGRLMFLLRAWSRLEIPSRYVVRQLRACAIKAAAEDRATKRATSITKLITCIGKTIGEAGDRPVAWELPYIHARARHRHRPAPDPDAGRFAMIKSLGREGGGPGFAATTEEHTKTPRWPHCRSPMAGTSGPFF